MMIAKSAIMLYTERNTEFRIGYRANGISDFADGDLEEQRGVRLE